MSAKRTPEEGLKWLQELAAGRGICITDTYFGVKFSYRWGCFKCWHTWTSSPSNIKGGTKNKPSWCPKCAGVLRWTLKEMRQLVFGKGKCLADKACNSKTKCEWECICGKRWWATLSDVAGNANRAGTWCPKCSKHDPWTLNRAHKLAQERGGQYLSDKVLGISDPCLWRCNKCLTEWKATPNNVLGSKNKKGSWCPKCAQGQKSEPERLLREAIRSLYPETVKKRGVLPNKRFEFDIWIPELKKCIEVDGPTHDLTRPGFRKFKQLDSDERKERECKALGISVLRVTDLEVLKDFNGTLQKCLEWLRST